MCYVLTTIQLLRTEERKKKEEVDLMTINLGAVTLSVVGGSGFWRGFFEGEMFKPSSSEYQPTCISINNYNNNKD